MATTGFSSLLRCCATWLGIYPISMAFLRILSFNASETSSMSRIACETVLIETFICAAIAFKLTFFVLI